MDLLVSWIVYENWLEKDVLLISYGLTQLIARAAYNKALDISFYLFLSSHQRFITIFSDLLVFLGYNLFSKYYLLWAKPATSYGSSIIGSDLLMSYLSLGRTFCKIVHHQEWLFKRSVVIKNRPAPRLRCPIDLKPSQKL